MTKGAFFMLSAATLALAACGKPDAAGEGTAGEAAANEASAATRAAETSEGQAFADKAAASDAFEIASSQLALTASSSAAVKSFAQAMIDAHTESTAKLKAAAAPALTPNPAFGADLQEKMDGLKGKTGPEFDRAYAAEQVAAHEAALADLRSYAESGGTAQLKAFASEMVPKVTAHLNMAQGLKP